MQARTKKPGKTRPLKFLWYDWTVFFFLHLQILLREKKIQDLKALFTSHCLFTQIFSFLTLFWKQIYSDWAIPTANKNVHRIHDYSTVYLLPYTCSCVLAVTADCTNKFPSSCLALLQNCSQVATVVYTCCDHVSEAVSATMDCTQILDVGVLQSSVKS